MTTAATYSKIATEIVKAQAIVIGPLAYDQATMVAGIVIESDTISVKGNGKQVLTLLVTKFEGLFGQASVEVCKDAIREMHMKVPPEDLPDMLR